MGQISSINFKKTNAIQTRHNDRDLAPNYLLKSGGLGVEYNRNHKEALELRNRIISDAMIKYQEVIKQPFKAKSYEWSAVCNVKETTTMQDLENLAKHFQDKATGVYKSNSRRTLENIKTRWLLYIFFLKQGFIIEWQ